MGNTYFSVQRLPLVLAASLDAWRPRPTTAAAAPRTETNAGGAMHPNAMDRRGKRKKRKERGDEAVANGLSASSAPFDRRVFPTLLAAAQTSGQSSISAALAARVLRRVLSRAPQMLSPLPDSLVALLPCLLSSR